MALLVLLVASGCCVQLPAADHAPMVPPAGVALQYGKYWASCDGPTPPRTCAAGEAIDRTPNTLWFYAPAKSALSSGGKPPLLVQIHGGGFVGGFPYTTCRSECQAAVANGMAYASFGYRLVGQTHYYGNTSHKQEEELILIDRAGALTIAEDGRKMSDYKVRTGNQELITKCVYDATKALDFLLQANHDGTHGVSFDASRVGFTGSSAGGAEINYLALVYPNLPGHLPYVPLSLVYPMAQIDYPIPLLDRGWGLWADDLGNHTPVSLILNQSDCAGIAGNIPKWCARPGVDCNMTWSQQATARCSPATYHTTTLGQMRDQFVWPTETEQDQGLTMLWYTSINLGNPTPRNFRIWVKNNLNATNAMSIIHSAFWARSYARFAASAGVKFATYYTDYRGKDFFVPQAVVSKRERLCTNGSLQLLPQA